MEVAFTEVFWAGSVMGGRMRPGSIERVEEAVGEVETDDPSKMGMLFEKTTANTPRTRAATIPR